MPAGPPVPDDVGDRFEGVPIVDRRRLRLGFVAALAAGLVAAAWAGSAPAATTPVVRILLAGDVMLGRGVASASSADPAGLLADVRFEVSSADLAVANLESPLTVRRHEPASGPNVLEARPAAARLLGAAGFDALGLANNHAGDAGPATVTDTLHALAAARLVAVGAGTSAASAFAPRIVAAGGLRVALLAFDATGRGPRAGPGVPGVARWQVAAARSAVARARAAADVVVVGLHGGGEYLPGTDPYLMRLARLLASWDVDVVWGTGPHVVQPVHVVDPDGDGRPTVVATSLGNFVFDQHIPGTQRGALLEVLAARDGVRAYRIGAVAATAPVRFLGWRSPGTPAVALGDDWWTAVRAIAAAEAPRAPLPARFPGDVVASALGDPDGDGRVELVVAFRRPYSRTVVSSLLPRATLVDRRGRSAHLGLYRPGDLAPLWVAGTLLRPVAEVAACDGAVAVAYSRLDGPAIVGAGAWRWGGFGFLPLPDLSRRGTPACADVDGDGRLDPVILERRQP